ncbi:hypothetical protein FAES_0497 [Fibrella aestuarina BUZ 2]|uniref:Uncharacterized protein n=1 Tax=Fibrella aestuarina BUZ 2 TaxID=1166018 RepID=I0K305_9BACT|nr:hypothetical protein [Fibrella aestuarina]CCG98508.1 hypothetical protein FAES_0497 [Fibrella aestuarina BUZ 2]
MHPRANVPVSPADFIHRGILDACRSAYQQLPSCFYGFDWIHFRLTAPNKIDSIRITGDYLPEWLTDFYESKILASQPFWHYVDKASNGPIVIAIPIDFALESGCDGNRSTKGRYELESAAIDSLFADKKQFLPRLKAVQKGKRQVILNPAFLHSMR